MTPILGITASSITSSFLGGDFESIATVTVGSGGAANATFSNIPQTYKHLQIRGIAKPTTNVGALLIYFNGQNINHNQHYMYGDGAGTTAGYESTNPFLYSFSSSVLTANMFGAGIVDILDYSDSNKFTTARALTGRDLNGSGEIVLTSVLYRSTSAITEIKLNMNTGNIAEFSSFALYGIK
jgi:hypothetical protein